MALGDPTREGHIKIFAALLGRGTYSPRVAASARTDKPAPPTTIVNINIDSVIALAHPILVSCAFARAATTREAAKSSAEAALYTPARY